jgi:aspartyl-tRNA(Asn)/glutamyl-tRNA(Gln) amidotransferase subunit A
VNPGATELLAGFASRAVSPVEALEDCVACIAERNGELRAFVALDLERARADARAAEAAWAAGRPAGPLCGVPVGVKDLFDTAGIETAYGSPMFAGRVPARDAEAVRRLRAAGAVIVGKTATHEFAWGITMRHAILGPTRNPWDPSRTPGGSSGGSAVAVAAGMVPLALGTDTGGSIRLPAALCGVVGHKPTHGLVSLKGVWPLVPEFDHAGPIARSAQDAALLLSVLADGLASAAPQAASPPRFGFALPMDVAPATEAALRAKAAELGAVEVELPDALPAYAPLFGWGAVHTHRTAGLWPGRRDEYDPTVRERMEIAELVTEAQVAAARRARTEVDAAMDDLFTRVDLILSPVCAWAPPPRLDDPVDFRPAVTPLLALQDLLGLPACTIPAGHDPTGVPIGLQLTGPRGTDARVLRAAS